MQFASELGCTGGRETIDLPDLTTTDTSTVQRIIETGCPQDIRLEYYIVEGSGHSWPGSPAVSSNNLPNQDIIANDVIFELFGLMASQ
jgi:hypothetical protein